MDWRRRPGLDPTDPNGVADLLTRAIDHGSSGAAVHGTRFLFRTADMVKASRRIERKALLDPSIPLFVGVQRAARLDTQHEIYTPLLAQGVTVHAFGTDQPPKLPVNWTVVEDDEMALESQWFVVRGGVSPEALVGFELETREGRRRWEGFHSHDPVLITRLVDHLQALTGTRVDA